MTVYFLYDLSNNGNNPNAEYTDKASAINAAWNAWRKAHDDNRGDVPWGIVEWDAQNGRRNFVAMVFQDQEWRIVPSTESDMDEKTANPMKRAEIPSQPQGRCVICDDHLGVGNGYWRHVYAGTNPDGTGRMAHKNCWRNMRDQLWLSFGVSLDDLCDEELAIRQASKPKLGKPPIWTGDKALQEALNTLVAEVDPDTPEDIDEIIRSAGYDPNEVAARGQNLAARLIAEHTLTRVEAWEGRLEAIDNAVAIQCFDGNWNYNEYMRGLANGLLFAQAVMNDRDYEPLDVPENYVEQRPNVQGPFIRRKE